MPFGKYKGAKLENMPDGYLLWLYENNKCFGLLKNYIAENLDSIRQNAKQEAYKSDN